MDGRRGWDAGGAGAERQRGSGPATGRYRGAESCRRCGTDLRQVVVIERAAAAHRGRALAALERGTVARARDLAERACALHRSADSLAVRALVALAEGRYALALEFAEAARRRRGRDGR